MVNIHSTVKQDINTTLKELKTERDYSHRQLLRSFLGSDSMA